jgi:uncharacterized protein
MRAGLEHRGRRSVSPTEASAAPATRELRVIDPAWIPLADGTRLCARIWLPIDAERDPVPAVLEYLPYRKDDVTAAEDARIHPWFAAHGYACVRVDIRGSGDSDGVLLDEYSSAEHDDALEVIAWLAAQPWCSGRVGMMGISWGGFNSLQVAARRPPALAAIITACSTDDRYDNDVHYLGGCPLGYYLLPWASVMLAFNARPPDPAIVGERWRELWQARLEGNVNLVETWLTHQRRDHYWRHGSVCEDYGAIRCPVLAVGGWADAYVDAIFRLLEHLECPRRAIVGPWGHQWPQQGRPGPAIGFLAEALRWWDHWLKDRDSGIMAEPMLRAFMQDAVAPAVDYDERPGRWIAEPTWPPPPEHRAQLRLWLDVDGLRAGAGAPGARSHHSDDTVGLDAGAWCPYGNPADLPPDQRRDDALSLCFESEPLEQRLELLGAPVLALRLAADRPVAHLFARLCDVAPDGASTLVTRTGLNLCHRDGHADPLALAPGSEVDVELALKSVAYAFPAGHRLRLALSTAYWPWLWPSPEPVTITVATGAASALSLPIRAPRANDPELRAFEPPQHAPPLAITWLRRRAPQQTIAHDAIAGVTSLRMARDFSGAQRLPSGLEYDDRDPVTFTIRAGDPLSARVECERRIELRRGEWRTRIEVDASMHADAANYHVTSVVRAYEQQSCIHTRSFAVTIPRDHT